MSLDVKNLLTEEDYTIKKVMQIIDRGGWRTAFVIDNNKRLVGSITDGDIRKAILRGEDINIPVSMIMNRDPIFLFEKDLTNRQLVREKIKELQFRIRDIQVIPIVNSRLNPTKLINLSGLTGVKLADSRSSKQVRKILIVGGAGYLGSVLVEKLINLGYYVRVLDILMFGEEPIQKHFTNPNFELIRGDMRHISVLARALKNIDAVINLAALVGDPACINNPSDTIETNYLANKILAEACRYNQINRFIFASTCSVYGQNDQVADESSPMNPVSLYARTKIHSEEGVLELEDENFAPTILRMATLYGCSPRIRFDLVVNTMTKDAISKKEISVHGGGTQWRPLLEVGDAVDVFTRCLEAPIDLVKGQIFNAGSEKQNYQIRNIAQEVHRLVPEAQLKIEETRTDNRNYAVSFAKVRDKLGFIPRKDISQAISEIKEVIINHIKDVNHKKYYNVDYTTEFIQNNKPAILGGEPLFEEPVPITKPTLPSYDVLKNEIESIINSGMITDSSRVKEFEKRAIDYIGCKHAIAVSSCTSGLMLILRALDLKGEVILPSFTFYATSHAILWNNLTPVFVDCDPETYNIDPVKVEKAIGPNTSAILAVHIFGNPTNVGLLEQIARKHNLKLIFDSAHGFGGVYRGERLGGSGDAECFSLSPTKLMTAGEGGVITTDNDELAKKIKMGRTYGDPGNYDCEFLGLSARMPEINALLGIKCMEILEGNIKTRNRLAKKYIEELSKISGISFQKIDPEDRSNYKDFSIYIDQEKLGIDRDTIAKALAKENIITKKYFYPPLHQQKIFKKYYNPTFQDLSVTEKISSNILSLPLYSHMTEEKVDKICNAIERIIKRSYEI